MPDLRAAGGREAACKGRERTRAAEGRALYRPKFFRGEMDPGFGALRESEKRFRSLSDSFPVGVFQADVHGHCLYSNLRLQQISGLTLKDSLGDGWTGAVHPEDRGAVMDAWKKCVREGIEFSGEFRFLTPQGEVRWVQSHASPMRSQTGQITGYVSITEDTTGRKLAEQALQEKNIELYNANLAKDRFLASMSHELRTPLNAIIGFTGTLLMKLSGPLTEEQSKQLQIIQSSAKHLLLLINDLLDLAKIESGEVSLTLEPVALQSVVEEVCSILRPVAEKKGLKLNMTVPDEHLVLKTDRRVLSQILLNLTNNAIKFTERGEVHIVLGHQRDNGKSWMQLSVHDTGMGIRPEDQPKLFQAFTRVGNDASRRQEGTGLGLHLSRTLAKLLGGQINFKSEYGKGSTFTLSLPES
jgi:PAS domain S-box-containing protein